MNIDNQKLDSKTGAVMSAITTAVIESIKNGTAPWLKPWQNRHDITAPANLATGNAYSGLNSLYLGILSGTHNCSYWIGYGQAKKKGGNVRKGEKSTAILAPIMRKGTDSAGDEYAYPAGFRVVRVFNIKQCDGLESPAPVISAFTPREINATALDTFAASTGAVIDYGYDRACYIPAQDKIQLPDREQFATAGGYYGTKLHELIHWTGHKSRLDRRGEKGRRGYAFEELIAELGAYYASEKLGCPNESENHASYLNSWLKALQNDPKYLWQAAASAERAAKYLIAITEKAAQVAA